MDDVRAVLDGSKRWCVARGDSAEVLAALPPSSVDALVSDPPSGIAFMGAEWDRNKGGRAQWVAWLAGILSDARRATRDGGRAVVWSLPRTSHWTGCAVEDAGWSIETTIAHLFGTGWPKGKAQTKPAQETWWLARTGKSEALNVEACRVRHATINGGNLADNPHLRGTKLRAAPAVTPFGRDGDETPLTSSEGRYPPNLLLSHAPGCVCEGTRRVAGGNDPRRADGTRAASPTFTGLAAHAATHTGYADPDGTEPVEAWACVEGCPVAELDRQSGVRTSGRHNGRTPRSQAKNAYGRNNGGVVPARAGDTGTASRYFPQFPADDPDAPWSEALFRYVAKPSRAEKEAGVTDVDPLPADAYAAHRHRRMEGEPERFDGAPVARASNDHPTVKSVALMRWLIRLITSPGDLVLDPFGGSGTTGVAALLEGRRVILVERDERFAAIARARCEHAAPTPGRIARVAAEPVRVVAPDYGPLFGGTR